MITVEIFYSNYPCGYAANGGGEASDDDEAAMHGTPGITASVATESS